MKLRESQEIIPNVKDLEVKPRSGAFEQYYARNMSPETLYSITNDPYSGTWGNAPGVQAYLRRQDEVLNTRFGGTARAVEGYMKLLNDSQVLASFEKFVTEIVQRPIVVTPASTSARDEYIAEFVRKCIFFLGLQSRQSVGKSLIAFNSDGFNNLIRSLAESYILGISGAGIVWKKQGKHIIPSAVQTVDPRRIEMTMSSSGEVKPRIVVWQSGGYLGKEIPARSFILHRHWSNKSYNDAWGMGLGRQIFPLVEFRRNLMSLWLQYADKNTTPNVVINYPVGLSKEDGDNLFKVGQTFGQGTVAMMPEGVSANYLTPSSSAPQVYQSLINYLDQQIGFLITGERDPSQSGQATGSKPVSEVLSDSVRVKKAKLFNDSLEQTLNNTLIRWIVELNFGFNTPIPKVTRNFSDLNDRTNNQAFISQLSMLKGLGLVVNDLDWIREKLNIPSLTYDPQVLQAAQGLPTEADIEDETTPEPTAMPEEDTTPSFAEKENTTDGVVTAKDAAQTLGIPTETLLTALDLDSEDSLVDIEQLLSEFLDDDGELAEPLTEEKRYKNEVPYGTKEFFELSNDLHTIDEDPSTMKGKATSQDKTERAISNNLRGTPKLIGFDQVTHGLTLYEQSALNMEVTEATSLYEIFNGMEEVIAELYQTGGADISYNLTKEDNHKLSRIDAALSRLKAVYKHTNVRWQVLVLRQELIEFLMIIEQGIGDSIEKYKYDIPSTYLDDSETTGKKPTQVIYHPNTSYPNPFTSAKLI